MSLSHTLYFGSKNTFKTILMLTCLATSSWASESSLDGSSSDDDKLKCGKPSQYTGPKLPPVSGLTLDSQRPMSKSPPAEGTTSNLTPRQTLAAALRDSDVLGAASWSHIVKAIGTSSSTAKIWNTLTGVAVYIIHCRTKEVESLERRYFETFYLACQNVYPKADEATIEDLFNSARLNGMGWEIEPLKESLSSLKRHLERPQSSSGRDIVQSASGEAITTPKEGSSRSSSSNPGLGSPPVSPALSFRATGPVETKETKETLERIGSLLGLLDLRQKVLKASRSAIRREDSEIFDDENVVAPAAALAALSATPQANREAQHPPLPASVLPWQEASNLDDHFDGTSPATAPSSRRTSPKGPTGIGTDVKIPTNGDFELPLPSASCTSTIPTPPTGGGMKPSNTDIQTTTHREDTRMANGGRKDTGGGI